MNWMDCSCSTNITRQKMKTGTRSTSDPAYSPNCRQRHPRMTTMTPPHSSHLTLGAVVFEPHNLALMTHLCPKSMILTTTGVVRFVVSSDRQTAAHQPIISARGHHPHCCNLLERDTPSPFNASFPLHFLDAPAPQRNLCCACEKQQKWHAPWYRPYSCRPTLTMGS